MTYGPTQLETLVVKLMRDLPLLSRDQLHLLLSTDLALVQAAQQCEPDASLAVVSCCEASQGMRVPESQKTTC
jgi:hypothetical protein